MSKVLLIEDEEIFVDMFGDSLKKAGFDFFSASNGAWGLKQALSEDFDLIIIDMMMPVMSGDEVVAKLKENDKTKNIPIIVISASVDETTQKRVEGMGISAFFIKTKITPTELSKKARELVNINLILERKI